MTMKVIGRRTIDRSKVRRILIRATNWVGDVVMTLPALEAVKDNFPESTVTVLAKPWVIPLFKNHPAVDDILPFRKGRGYLFGLGEIIRISCLLRKQGFDLAILFQNAFEAAFLSYLGGIGLRIGYNTDGRGFLLSHTVIRDEEVSCLHQVEYYLAILRAMGWKAEGVDPRLFVDEKDEENVKSMLLKRGIVPGDFLIGLSPGAVFGPAKRWPPERFAMIGDRAAQRWGAKVVIMGSQGEKDIGETVGNAMKHTPLNLCGMTTLGEAMALIKRCDFFVTNDSGLMHIAAALDIPMIAIFGSTDPVATGPRSHRAKIIRHEMDCAPCLKPECPKNYDCLLGIEAGEVWKEMEILREMQI